jgi:regulator of protease activity HflC (stomatin/prohibitin superfamily)
MGFFVLAVILVLIGVGTFVGGRMAHTSNPSGAGGLTSVVGPLIAFVLLLILTVFFSVSTISPGNIGIKKSFGKLDAHTTSNGVVLHNPWTTVSSVSVQNTLKVYDMTENNSAVTSDSQPVFLTVQVNYQIKPQEARDLYQSTGGDYVNRVLDPNVFQFTKEVTAKYTATAFAQNREAIRREIEQRLGDAVGPQGIQINNVSLKNVQFTPALQAAIERTVESTQNAKREEAQVRVVQAQAAQKVAKAKGDAEATLTQARADASSQRLKQRTLTPLLVQMAAIDKLNPNVSVIVCNQGQACIPNAVLATTGK